MPKYRPELLSLDEDTYELMLKLAKDDLSIKCDVKIVLFDAKEYEKWRKKENKEDSLENRTQWASYF